MLNRTGSPVIRFMLRQNFGKVMLVSHEQRSYAWKLTDSGVKSGYIIGWHSHFHGYGHLRRICGEAWRICRFRGSVWAFWLNHLKQFCTVIGLYFRRIRSVRYSSTRHYIVNIIQCIVKVVFICVYYFERLSEEFYYFYERFLPAISGNIFNNVHAVCDCGKRFGISTFSTTFVYVACQLEKNIDASRTNFVDKLLSGAINGTSRSLARNFGAESYC
jgi:hypothetical protein